MSLGKFAINPATGLPYERPGPQGNFYDAGGLTKWLPEEGRWSGLPRGGVPFQANTDSVLGGGGIGGALENPLGITGDQAGFLGTGIIGGAAAAAGLGPVAGAAANALGGSAFNSGGTVPTTPRYGFEPWLGGGTGGNGGNSGGLFDNLLGTVGNLSPALLAGYLGNSQRQDVMGQVGKINDVASGLNGPAFMQSITNPYDLQTGQGRTALSQSLQQRGVGGSSFGNQQLGNYDYQRGLGRGDLATRAGTAVAGTQGQLYGNALHGMVGANAAYNNLLGAGLGASGSLFNRGSGNPLAGLIGGAGGMGGSLSNYLGNLFGTGADNTPIGVDPYGGNPGGQVDFGNAPSLGIPDSTSGNGLFDWLNQNGAGGDLGLNF